MSSASLVAFASFCTIGCGVPLGNENPPQAPQSRPFRPCDSMVGSVSRPGAGSGPSAASALTVPDWICGTAVEICSNM